MYQAKYGSISIPEIHKNLAVGASERDAWLSCMKLALDDQGYPESFKTYLLEQLFIPAERIRSVCAHNV
jgi:hemoglobin